MGNEPLNSLSVFGLQHIAVADTDSIDEPTAPNPTVVEDELAVATHDTGEMDSPLQYYDDDGNMQTLPATVNQSQDTPVGVRFDLLEADGYYQLPRTDSEDGTSANWPPPREPHPMSR